VPRRRFLGLLAGALTGVGAACAGSPGSRERADDAGVPEPSRRRYADHPDGFGDLWLPAAGGEGLPVVVLVHGGFWQAGFGLDLMDGLAASVAGAGWAAWNIEYRRVGGGGGYPQTFDDVAAAVDHLAQHLQHEERDALRLVQAHLTQERWDRMEQEHFAGKQSPRELLDIVGWVLHDLPEEGVQRMRSAPRGTVLLVVWKGFLRGRFARRERRAFRYLPA